MLSSNKVIKADRASSGVNKVKITTDYQQPKQIKEVQEENSTTETEEKATLKKVDDLLKEAEIKSQQLIKQSQAEIAQIKETAQKEGYQIGHEKGFQRGYEIGYSEGLEQAKLENQEIREGAIQMLHETHEKMQIYQAEKKDEFLKLAIHMAEKIVHDYIDQADDDLLAIAKPFFYQLDKEEEFVTISVNPEKREVIDKNINEIKSISPGTRFMILGDPSLDKMGMLIESSHAVVDLQIRNQLDRMLEEFYEMERTIDA